MPNYYSPYALYPASYPVMASQPTYSYAQAPQSGPAYMISVDSEIGAKAWQMPANLPPNTVIPLWDLDGKHVYFKSVDAYGRLNPMRKGVVVFEDDSVPQQSGEAAASQPSLPDMTGYVTKEDLNAMKQELRQMILQSRKNTNNMNNDNRGENR